jgi:predicted O-methyltransferase YrrM
VTELVAAFVTALQPDYVIETGTASAQTAVAIGKALKRNGQGRLVTLEVDRHRVEAARSLCAGLPVEVRQLASLDFEPQQRIDFAWFDSLINLRVPEFRRYFPFMHNRTVVGFHDTSPDKSDLQEQIDGLADEGLLRYILLPTPRGATFAQVIKR